MKEGKFMNKTILLIALLGLFKYSSAQNLPEIIPPSPVSREFQKFLGYPVSPATGIADISVPLYNLHSAGIDIPFSLQYHSSGIKVYESPGNIGYGWTLFPGFRITRTIMGKPDDYAKTDDIRNASTYNSENSIGIDQYLCNTAVTQDSPTSYPDPSLGQSLDGQYDIFSIHLPNLNTTFILQWINGELTGVPIPEAPIKIKPVRISSGTGPLFFDYFEVTDDKGVVYIFGKDHKDYATNSWSSTSEWMLDKIIAPGVGNTIDFTYSNSTVPWYGGLTTQYFEVDDKKSYGASNCENPVTPQSVFGDPLPGSSYNDYTYNTWSLTSMSFREGRIDFAYEDQGLSKLNSVKVYNTQNEKVKDVGFSRLAGWNLLNTVTISGEGQYSFEYDMQAFTYQNGQDFSGYYNGQNNDNLIPTISLEIDGSTPGGGSGTYTQSFSGANRQPDEQKMQSHILKKINYPTGGYTQFNYEANKFISKGVPSFGMGLRIASTQGYDPVSGKTITNTYKYGENESGYGNLGTGYYVNNQISALDENAFVSDRVLICADCWCNEGASVRRRTVSSNNKFSNFSFNLPVWYSEVNVYSDGGKTTYRYNYTPSYFVDYPVGIPCGTFTMSLCSSDTRNYYINELRNLGLSGPRLTDKQIWSGEGKLLQETSYDYTGEGAGLTGIIVDPVATYMGHTYADVVNNYPSSNTSENLINSDPRPFIIQNYTIEKNNDNIASITQKDYQDDKVLETITNFDYEDIPYTYNVKSKSVTTSTNGTLTEKYYYPTSSSIPDISSLSSAQQAMVTTLLNNNRLTTLIQKNTSRNNTPLNSTLFGYKDWGNSIYTLEQAYNRTNSNPFESRLHYYSYDDKGNVTTVSKENDVKKTYLWGYNKTYPVAEIIGTDYNTASGYISQATLDNPPDDATFRSYLDNLRNIPNALGTTFTYKPLVGMTSMTDANGRTTYYEYDDFGRLSLIRDQNNNILKKFCYNYQGQQEQCSVFESAVINGYYYSQNCGSQTPVAYYVSVPAGQFTSTLSQPDADQQAQAYAQAQANQYGTCQASNVSLYYNNNVGVDFILDLYNVDTGEEFWFDAYSFTSGNLGDVPPGNYNITIDPQDFWGYTSFSVGCGYYNSGSSTISFYGVPLSDGCNSFDMN
jgi:YD repeat-containing protein